VGLSAPSSLPVAVFVVVSLLLSCAEGTFLTAVVDVDDEDDDDDDEGWNKG